MNGFCKKGQIHSYDIWNQSQVYCFGSRIVNWPGYSVKAKNGKQIIGR